MLQHGFLGYNASFMLDVIVCALVLFVPALACSIWLVKTRRRYLLHRNIQLALCAILLLTVGAFEVDLQLVHGGWENVVAQRVEPLTADELEFVHQLLLVHLVFAVSSPALWIATIVLAWRRFPNPPAPSVHSKLHSSLGWLSAIDITLTSITGLAWYYFAFVR